MIFFDYEWKYENIVIRYNAKKTLFSTNVCGRMSYVIHFMGFIDKWGHEYDVTFLKRNKINLFHTELGMKNFCFCSHFNLFENKTNIFTSSINQSIAIKFTTIKTSYLVISFM